jgi:hypothetical protein
MNNQRDFIKEVYDLIAIDEYTELEYILNTYGAMGYVGEESTATIMEIRAVSRKNNSALLFNPMTENEKWCKIKVCCITSFPCITSATT